MVLGHLCSSVRVPGGLIAAPAANFLEYRPLKHDFAIQRESELVIPYSYILEKKGLVFSGGPLGDDLVVLECGNRLEYHIGISIWKKN